MGPASDKSRDLSLAGSVEIEGSAPIVPLMPLPPSPCPGTPEAAASALTLEADFCLPSPLHESPQSDVSIVHLDGFLTVVGDAIGIPAHSGGPSPAGTAAPGEPTSFGNDFDAPAWFDSTPAEPLSPASVGPDAADDPPRPCEATPPLPLPGTSPITIRPVLTPRDLVMIARSTYGIARSDMLVSAITIGFTTPLSHDEIAARLQLLWLMGREYANHVRDTVLLGQARRESPSLILTELLHWADPYVERHRFPAI